MNDKPYLIQFNRIGEPAIGYISVAEVQELIPFEIKRVYWTYFTPENITRGGHAHQILEQVLIAVAGRIIVQTELPNGLVQEFVLDSPNKGLFIPQLCWRTMKYSHNAVQLCIANSGYEESDYIRDYDEFKKLNDPSNR